MKRPLVSKARLNLRPINWGDLSRRYMNVSELETLIALFRSVKPKTCLEIGVNSGRTAKAVLMNIDSVEHYQGIDVLPGYEFEKQIQRKEIPDAPGQLALGDPRFELIVHPRGSFDVAAEELRMCDAVFIDGDHGRSAVLHDTRLALELILPGGIIVWHDDHDLGSVDVSDVLDELHRDDSPIYRVHGTWLAYLRIP